jgi:hypothetical protein
VVLIRIHCSVKVVYRVGSPCKFALVISLSYFVCSVHFDYSASRRISWAFSVLFFADACLKSVASLVFRGCFGSWESAKS